MSHAPATHTSFVPQEPSGQQGPGAIPQGTVVVVLVGVVAAVVDVVLLVVGVGHAT